jgi:hypothetical protein
MVASDPAHDPEGDAFLDALAGLDSVCRWLAIVLGEAVPPGGPDPGDGAGEANDEGMPEGMIDALLGLVSVHRTVSLLLAAVPEMGGAAADPPVPEEPPAWSREVLR